MTGGNSGIGFGMADALAAAGAQVAVWGTNVERNASAVDRLSRHGNKAVAVRCDVGDPEQVSQAMTETVAALGKVDTCVANAGVGGVGQRFLDLTPQEWHRVLRINLDGVFLTFQAAARHMAERGEGGSLIAVSSIIGTAKGEATTQAYATSKAGLGGLVRSCAVELGRYGIRANSVQPGWIETPLAKDLLEDKRFGDEALPRIPSRRWGRPEDLGGIAVYLASDASRYHTGDDFVVDGGYVIG
ncbi:SDR family oxidoreductase [Streptomyces sp. SID4956]|uniref:SDR family NAD(P)-dependent oxidoreductase n=1 Tax=Streptomyces sp. SID4956 TaxID=2690290 RepID=UPI0031FE1F3B